MAKRTSPKRKRCRAACKRNPKRKRAACVRKCMKRRKKR